MDLWGTFSGTGPAFSACQLTAAPVIPLNLSLLRASTNRWIRDPCLAAVGSLIDGLPGVSPTLSEYEC